MTHSRFLAALAIVFVGAALRLVDIGGYNFAPIGAIAVFSGLTFRNKWLAFGLPLIATLIGDVGLALQNGNDFGTYLLSPIMLFVYAGWLMYAGCGLMVRRSWNRTNRAGKRGWLLCGGSVAGSVLFFFVTNMGVWALGAVHSIESLGVCFGKAIPFFPRTLSSDLIYLAAFVATHVVVTALVRNPDSKTDALLVYAD